MTSPSPPVPELPSSKGLRGLEATAKRHPPNSVAESSSACSHIQVKAKSGCRSEAFAETEMSASPSISRQCQVRPHRLYNLISRTAVLLVCVDVKQVTLQVAPGDFLEIFVAFEGTTLTLLVCSLRVWGSSVSVPSYITQSRIEEANADACHVLQYLQQFV